LGIEDSYAEPAVIPELDSKRSGNASKLPGVHSGVMSSRQLIAASILFTRSSRTSTVIGIEKEGTGIAAGTLIGVVAQYSSGRRIVVDERSASVMTQIFVPFLRL
jgi:hypothetical protein